MPGQVRPNKKLMKVAYTILATPDNMRQRNEPEVSKERQKGWIADNMMSR